MEEVGQGVPRGGFDSGEELMRDGITRSHVLEDKSLMFKLLPLSWCEGESSVVSCTRGISTHHHHLNLCVNMS